jgi:hypothetical protein
VSDARFEDGLEKPLRLIAFDAEDLQVLSAMTQDAVLPVAQMTWHSSERRFALAAQPLSLGGSWRVPDRARAINFEL